MLQVVHYTNGEIKNTPIKLISFILNDKIDQIVIKINFNQVFDEVVLNEFINWVKILKDEVEITSKFSLVSFTDKSLTIKAQFQPSININSSIYQSKGEYYISISKPIPDITLIKYDVIILVDDKNLNINCGVKKPQIEGIGKNYKPFVQLHWMGEVVENAQVKVMIYPPGSELSNILIKNPIINKPYSELGADIFEFEEILNQKKYQKLFSLINFQLAKKNFFEIPHIANGNYESIYKPTVTGVYHVEFSIKISFGELEENIQRVVFKNFTVSVGSIDQNTANKKIYNSRLIKILKNTINFKWSKIK